ncbi:unnamed protein product [marine sediment metagenome]|uniref:Uncharacterized protein n=1 Tax=marine sediment metagenome TaxID=412755 RepID=X0U2S7_9ZZZZ
MDEILFVLAGILGTTAVMFLGKWLGNDKGEKMAAVDTERTTEALTKASELIGKRAEVEAEAEEDKQRIKDKLAIKDPVERLEAIAGELKDL